MLRRPSWCVHLVHYHVLPQRRWQTVIGTIEKGAVSVYWSPMLNLTLHCFIATKLHMLDNQLSLNLWASGSVGRHSCSIKSAKAKCSRDWASIIKEKITLLMCQWTWNKLLFSETISSGTSCCCAKGLLLDKEEGLPLKKVFLLEEV